MSQNPATTESPAVHITHATTYATVAMAAQALVTLLLPQLGLHLPSVVIAAIVSLLIGGGTVVLHMAGLAVPGTPLDSGQEQVRAALRTLVREEGPTLLAYLTRTPVPPSGPAPPPMGTGVPPVAAEPMADLMWAGPPPRPPVGAGHAPVPPPAPPTG